jgi:hypothetical protein
MDPHLARQSQIVEKYLANQNPPSRIFAVNWPSLPYAGSH